MPITAWICQGCGGRVVPLDHFETSECGTTTCHPDYAAAVLADRASQPTGTVRVTHGLGCPRRVAIEEAEGYAVDPLGMNTAMTGVAWHAMMDKGSKGQGEIEVRGEIDGISLVGHFDRYRKGIMEDHKHIKTWNLKYKKKEGADAAYVAQVSIYGELAEQSGLGRPERAIIWYHTTDDGFWPVEVPLMSVDEALAVHPYGCDYSVRELYGQMKIGRWQDMPKAGESIKFGQKTGCDYCSVRSICQGEF